MKLLSCPCTRDVIPLSRVRDRRAVADGSAYKGLEIPGIVRGVKRSRYLAMFSVDSDIAVRNGREAAGMSDASLLRSLVVMARHRRLILGGMLVTAVLTAVVVLVIPATY